MQLTQKIRIHPTAEQEQLLWILSEKCRLLYNFALAERKAAYEDNNKDKPESDKVKVNYYTQASKLKELKKRFPEYRWVYSKVLQQVLKKLQQNYNSFFVLRRNWDESAMPPIFRSHTYFTTLCYNQSGFKLADNRIRFSHKHPSNTELSFKLTYPYEGTDNVKQIELSRDHRNRWFVIIVYESDNPEYTDNGLYQAIDLGITNIVSAVNIYGRFIQFKNRRADLYWKSKLSEVQSKRDHCKKYSNRWHLLNDKLITIKQKQTNQLRDFQHKISKQVVENTKANTIIVGDLNIKQMAKRKKGAGNAIRTKSNRTLSHSLQNTGSLGRFVRFLKYKAELVGKKIIKIDESYTTQACCKCGNITERKLYERFINCDCGNEMNRDLNSAVNIMVRFLENKSDHDFLSQERSLDEQSFLNSWNGFMRHTAKPVSSGADSHRATDMFSSSLIGNVKLKKYNSKEFKLYIKCP